MNLLSGWERAVGAGGDEPIAVRPAIAIPGRGGEGIVQLRHLRLQHTPVFFQAGAMSGIIHEVFHLVRIRDVVEQDLLAGQVLRSAATEDGVGETLVAKGAPFVAVLPDGAGARVQEKRGFGFGAGSAYGQVAQVHALDFFGDSRVQPGHA